MKAAPSSITPVLALMLAIAAGLGGCGKMPEEPLHLSGPTMGTYYDVKIAQYPAGIPDESIQRGIEEVLGKVVAEISTYDASSELSRLNQNPSTDWIPISENLLEVISEGQRLSELSHGAFDITIGPLVNLWGFGPEHRAAAVPAADAVQEARARVGYGKLQLRTSPPAIRKQRGDIYIDLSALGEGYGAQRVAAYLDGLGVSSYMVAIAGTLRVKGLKADGGPWKVAIEEPSPDRRIVDKIVRITDAGISTSGDYRNFFEEGGKRYSHEIDPKTGAPVSHRLASVTVVGTDLTRTDGLATMLMVMGEKDGPELAQAEGIPALFIIHEGSGFSERSTPAFQRYLSP
jgi:FAD:protein FMN transferase